MLTPEDHLAIRELYARYNHAISAGDGDAWAALFTPDGCFSNARETVRGTTNLAVYSNDFARARNARYWVDNIVIEATPEGAAGACYLALYHVTPGEAAGPATLQLTGLYSDTFTKWEGQWRFATRHIPRDTA